MSVPKPFSPVEGLDHGAIKVWMWLRQDGKCLLCGEPIDLTIPRNRYGAASTEHKRPVVRGGSNGRGNLALTHWECNKRRGSGTWLKQTRPAPGDQIVAYSGGARLADLVRAATLPPAETSVAPETSYAAIRDVMRGEHT